MSRANRSISTASMATLVATIVIVIAIGTYALITFGNIGAVQTASTTTCSETTSTFTVDQNGSPLGLAYLIPASPCVHQVSLSGFTLKQSGAVSGNVHVDSNSQLSMFLIYLNGTYETFNDFAAHSGSSFTVQYNAVFSNSTLPIMSGSNYVIEIVAVFKDGTATPATTVVTASE